MVACFFIIFFDCECQKYTLKMLTIQAKMLELGYSDVFATLCKYLIFERNNYLKE